MRSGLAVVALVLWLAPAVSGADVFRYETEEGTIAFTDDVKRPELSLWDHPRVTIVESRRDETVRAQPAVEAPAAEAPSSPSLAFEVSPGLWMDLEADADNPVEVEREWRWVDGVLRPHTVVRQGGKVLAVRIQN
jgi:hypothetical protein